MSERKTISQSKGIFHKEFPYVIPSIYRKVIDEYLVELNLLSNQKQFKLDAVFAYGLVNSFETFTQGYEPQEHVLRILESICNSCGIDYSIVKSSSKMIYENLENTSLTEFIKSINENPQQSKIEKGFSLVSEANYYSRLHTIGIYILVTKLWSEGSTEEDIQKSSLSIALALGFPENRVTKDLNQFKNNVNRVKEAIELVGITVEENQRRQSKK